MHCCGAVHVTGLRGRGRRRSVSLDQTLPALRPPSASEWGPDRAAGGTAARVRARSSVRLINDVLSV
eukprot:765437-Hanusia_phi.AAC.3